MSLYLTGDAESPVLVRTHFEVKIGHQISQDWSFFLAWLSRRSLPGW